MNEKKLRQFAIALRSTGFQANQAHAELIYELQQMVMNNDSGGSIKEISVIQEKIENKYNKKPNEKKN